jgi:hypothetical protein
MMKMSAAEGYESSAEEPRKIIVVTNWFEELKVRVHME